MIRNVIFDLDGTLSNTAKATIPACAAVSKQFGLPELSADHIRNTMGYANPEFYFRLYPDVEKDIMLRYCEAVEMAEAQMIGTLGADVLFPHIIDMLHALHERGMRLYIASTGDPQHVDATIDASGIRGLFDGISCGEPEKVAMVSAIIGNGNKAEYAMVGDKLHDLRAARGNGITAIAAGYGYCNDEDAVLFDHVLASPMDMLSLVREP